MLVKIINQTLNILIALALTFMAVLVFGNVVLRYAFNSGITWSEEMSRFLFVWLVFLGAIAAFKDNMHLGMDLITNLLPKPLKKIVFVLSNMLVLYVLWLLFNGSLRMTLLNMGSLAPATKLPLGFVYGVGVITSVSMALIVVRNLLAAFKRSSKSGNLSMVPDHKNDVPEDPSVKVQNM
ncbi:TRAP transporter small permease [Bacillus sp. Marseille-Q3570]|uniref:TRAP transporter small permease n=1 Tax=Bacillus sp. Marseille-Q3570 TaxID=2963522 RepID=UPI0021B7D1E8|nr:TRAP transporter small permease [Bacillus sp. Marseille-Q3570]